MIEWIRERVLSNPVLGRQLRTTFTGGRLGWAFLLVNGVFVALYLTLFAFFSSGIRGLDSEAAGQVLLFWHHITLLGLMILLVPLKISGSIEGPRVDRAFDQVVVTGVSPLRFFAGSWVSGLVYTALILFVTLPFAGCMAALARVSVADIAMSYAVLFAYSSVIITVTLALAIQMREWFSTPLTIVLFAFLLLFGLLLDRDWVRGYPTVFAELTPARYFWEEFRVWRAVGVQSSWLADTFSLPHFFGWVVPLPLIRIGSWLLVIALAGAAIVSGPGHSFVSGQNNFGAVVLPGDRKRRFFNRFRGGLTRRVEVGFFFENVGPWLARWELPIRFVMVMIASVLWWGFLNGGVYHGTAVPTDEEFGDDPAAILTLLALMVPAILCLLAGADGRPGVYAPKRFLGWTLRREFALTFLFVILLGGVFVVHYTNLEQMRAASANGAFGGPTTGYRNPLTTAQSWMSPLDTKAFAKYEADWWPFTIAMFVFMANAFLISRVLTRTTNLAAIARISVIAALIAYAVIPFMICAGVDQDAIAASAMGIGNLSPVVIVEEIDHLERSMERQRAFYFGTHGVLAASLLTLITLLHIRATIRRRAFLAGLGAAATASVLVLLPANALAQVGPQGLDEAWQFRRIPTSDEASPIVIEAAHRAFGGQAAVHGVDFYTVQIRNRTDEFVEGEYWVENSASGDGRAYRFSLSGGATQVLRWSVGADDQNQRNDLAGTRVVFRISGSYIATGALDMLIPPNPGQRWGNAQNKPVAQDFLVAGTHGAFPEEWSKLCLNGESFRAPFVPALTLPTEGLAYEGYEAVFLPAAQLPKCTPEQQQALYQFARLGGSVVLWGELLPHQIAGSGAWEPLLANARHEELQIAGRAYSSVELEESTVRFTTPDPNGGGAIPVIQSRALGAGTLSHLTFPPLKHELPEAVTASPEFWSGLNAALPRSKRLILTQGITWPRIIRDSTTLVYLVGYFVIYTVVFSAGLMFFARGRERRRRLLILLGVGPTACLLLVPVLGEAIDQRPSASEYNEVLYFQSGSRHGVASGCLDIASSGRQSHAVSVRGDSVTAYELAIQQYGYFVPNNPGLQRVTDPLPTTRDGDRYTAEFHMLPWSSHRTHWVGNATLSTPISGRATIDAGRSRIDFSVELPPEYQGAQVCFAILDFEGDIRSKGLGSLNPPSAIPSVESSSGDTGSTFSAQVTYVPKQNRYWYHQSNVGGFNLAQHSESHVNQTLAYAVIYAPNAECGLTIESDQLNFRRRYIRRDRMLRLPPDTIVERDGREEAISIQRAILVELPIEVK